MSIATFLLSRSPNATIADSMHTWPVYHVNAFDKHDAHRILDRMKRAGLIASHTFERPISRMHHLGMSGRAFQNGFTVACGLTHRRAWQTFLKTNATYGLFREADAMCSTWNPYDAVHVPPSAWDFLQLGRCWDFCQSQVIQKRWKNRDVVTSESPCCSHAYILTRRGANLLLRYSVPHTTSIDLLFTLLSRLNILRLYSVSPPLCVQRRDENAHDDTPLLECDPNEKELKYTLPNRDAYVVSQIRAGWIHQYLQGGAALPTSCPSTSTLCVRGTGTATPEAARPVNIFFKKHNLRRFVVWGKASKSDFQYFQHAFYDNMRSMLRPNHRVCWYRKVADCSLRNALILVSPRGAMSPDQNVAFHSSNQYLFHGTPPHPFRAHENWHQLHLRGDTLHVDDALDYVTRMHEIAYAAPNLLFSPQHRAQDRRVYFTYDVPTALFCTFLAKSPYPVVKYWYERPRCLRNYTYVHRRLMTKDKAQLMHRSERVPVLTYGPLVPEEFYIAARAELPIVTNNEHVHRMMHNRTRRALRLFVEREHTYERRIHKLFKELVND